MAKNILMPFMDDPYLNMMTSTVDVVTNQTPLGL